MLQKTMVTLEGIGFTLYPDVNMWQLAEPWIASWAKQNFGFKTRTTKKLKAAIATLDAIPDLINAAHDAIQQGQKCRTENPSAELNESQAIVSHPNSERRKVLIFLLGILTGIAAYHFVI
jgi:ubiquinone biosynthesis protein